MYVCLCRGVTDRDIRRAVCEDKLDSMSELRRVLDVATCCGRCAGTVRTCLAEAKDAGGASLSASG